MPWSSRTQNCSSQKVDPCIYHQYSKLETFNCNSLFVGWTFMQLRNSLGSDYPRKAWHFHILGCGGSYYSHSRFRFPLALTTSDWVWNYSNLTGATSYSNSWYYHTMTLASFVSAMVCFHRCVKHFRTRMKLCAKIRFTFSFATDQQAESKLVNKLRLYTVFSYWSFSRLLVCPSPLIKYLKSMKSWKFW